MDKCGICGMEVKKPPIVTDNGKCSECNHKLKMEERSKQK